MLRSVNGCWTCKIRHRKCDESRPQCRECNDRHIQCHGYGPKPGWVSDQTLVDAELAHIKAVVKQNVLGKRRGRHDASSITDNKALADQDPVQMSQQDPEPRPFRNISFRESYLLIHYLDYIFPLQVPYYVDQPELGGRGWLFWLLMKNGPLNQAILTLSALHHSAMLGFQTSGAEEELITYHTEALQGLRKTLCQHKGDGYPTDDQVVDFLACGISLISFEVFRGGTGDWQPHLNALCKVVNDIASRSIQSLAGSQGETSDGQKILGGKENAQRFFIGSVIWFDALACTSTGTAPKVCHSRWLTERGIDMSYLMGCYNWVIIAIGDIAAIRAQGRSQGFTNSIQAVDVENRLQAGLKELDSSAKHPEPKALPISRVYAAAALVELYTICPHLYPADSGIREAVARVMDSIHRVPDHMSLRGLTWAICIAGSMAKPDQHPFFESMMQQILCSSKSGFSNCDTAFHIVRQCWLLRKNFPEGLWDWRDAMEAMGICALLV